MKKKKLLRISLSLQDILTSSAHIWKFPTLWNVSSDEPSQKQRMKIFPHETTSTETESQLCETKMKFSLNLQSSLFFFCCFSHVVPCTAPNHLGRLACVGGKRKIKTLTKTPQRRRCLQLVVRWSINMDGIRMNLKTMFNSLTFIFPSLFPPFCLTFFCHPRGNTTPEQRTRTLQDSKSKMKIDFLLTITKWSISCHRCACLFCLLVHSISWWETRDESWWKCHFLLMVNMKRKSEQHLCIHSMWRQNTAHVSSSVIGINWHTKQNFSQGVGWSSLFPSPYTIAWTWI